VRGKRGNVGGTEGGWKQSGLEARATGRRRKLADGQVGRREMRDGEVVRQ